MPWCKHRARCLKQHSHGCLPSLFTTLNFQLFNLVLTYILVEPILSWFIARLSPALFYNVSAPRLRRSNPGSPTKTIFFWRSFFCCVWGIFASGSSSYYLRIACSVADASIAHSKQFITASCPLANMPPFRWSLQLFNLILGLELRSAVREQTKVFWLGEIPKV